MAPKFNATRANEMLEKHSQKTRESRLKYDEYLKLSEEAVKINANIKSHMAQEPKDLVGRLNVDKELKKDFDRIYEVKSKIDETLTYLKDHVKYPIMAQQLIDNTINHSFDNVDKK